MVLTVVYDTTDQGLCEVKKSSICQMQLDDPWADWAAEYPESALGVEA
jgi:hypothetical protein